MSKRFNTNGDCKSEIHYMVDISDRLKKIKKMIDAGEYFTINRARQYGKTTMLKALSRFLKDDYLVIRMDFQRLGYASFETEEIFVKSFAMELFEEELPNEIEEQLSSLINGDFCTLQRLFKVLMRWCRISEQKIVLMIDEVDSATNNQVFLDFLAQLRSYYLDRDERPTFQSVILAGVHDVKNVRSKIKSEDTRKINSPWNIAADFDIVMSFSKEDIRGMLCVYEADYQTGMALDEMSELLYDYTSGYPYLVSRICKLIDEKVVGNGNFPDRAAAWTQQGFLKAIGILLSEKNTLFESLIGKLIIYPELQRILYSLLFVGDSIVYNVFDEAMNTAIMFGFIKKQDGSAVIANRIFETLLYNYFLTSEDAQNTSIFIAASNSKSQFIYNGRLNMDLVMKKFVEHFDSIYGDQAEEFDESEGRRRFLLYIRPIINGVGNYYIESETRNARRMDVVIDYLGERFIIELKIWRGTSYNERGEKQLSDYLDYFNLKKGYMLSYNFNQKKQVGVKEIHIGDRTLVEAVV